MLVKSTSPLMEGILVYYNILNFITILWYSILKVTVHLSFYSSYVISGDADGKLTVWEWKNTRIYTRFKVHDSVCIGCLWLPHETSKVVTCGWDGAIKLWD